MAGTNKKPVLIWRTVIQIIALVFFLFLTIKGINQIWMMIMLGSLVLTLLFGRFYCGWLCPIHTVMRLVEKITVKLNIQRNNTPGKLKSPWLRYSIFTAFVIVLFVNIRGIAEIDVLLILIVTAAILTFILPPSAWHRYLCPFGVLFSLPARVSLFRFNINQDKCKGCGLCKQKCPAESVITAEQSDNKQQYSVYPQHCLFCFECSEHCPQKAIKASIKRSK